MIRNLNWYALNAIRNYPVDDAATSLDAAGHLLPHNIVADLKLVFPTRYGRYAYINAVTVTEKIVSVTILGSTTLNGGELSPLAAVSLPQPVVPWQAYSLEALAADVGGWIVFGDGVKNQYQGRFATCAQTRLSGRAAIAVDPPPVTGLSKLGDATALTGIVRLKGGTDLVVEAAEATIDSVLRDVIRIRLREPRGSTDNIFDRYKGRCGLRPESKNCGDPQPIEAINDVTPDCCGRIIIRFRGCAQPSQVLNDSSAATLDCEIGLRDVCDNSGIGKLPGEGGTLPHAITYNCEPDAELSDS